MSSRIADLIEVSHVVRKRTADYHGLQVPAIGGVVSRDSRRLQVAASGGHRGHIDLVANTLAGRSYTFRWPEPTAADRSTASGAAPRCRLPSIRRRWTDSRGFRSFVVPVWVQALGVADR